MANFDVIPGVNGSPLIEEHRVGHWMARLAANVVRVFRLNNEMTETGWRLVVTQNAIEFEDSLVSLIPESGAFSLAKRGPRGELAAIRGDFGILSLT